MDTEVESSRHSKSLYSNRTIEPHGIEKYLVTLERKNADRYNQILTNRIQKLIKEEENCKRQFEMANSKAMAIMSNKERKMKETKFKEMIKKKRKDEEEEQRIRNFIERENRKRHISSIQDSILNKKREVVKEMRKNEEIGDCALQEYKQLIEKKKIERVQVLKYQVDVRKNNRSRSEFTYKSKLRQDYEARIEEEKQLYERSLSKRKELEAKESELMQKMSQTHNLPLVSPQSFSSHVFNTSYSQSPAKF